VANERTTAYVVAGVLAVGGVGLVIMALQQQSGPGTPGHEWSPPYVPGFPSGGTAQIPLGSTFHVLTPKIKYKGPGFDAFTYLQVKQSGISVMGSGVAGTHVGPSGVLAEFDLVSPTQPQPAGEPPQSLMAGPWPGLRDPSTGNIPTPVCGRPAVAGPGDIYLEVYQKDSGDGYSAPTCNKRTLIKSAHWSCTFV
jgi:hypothetical protein